MPVRHLDVLTAPRPDYFPPTTAQVVVDPEGDPARAAWRRRHAGGGHARLGPSPMALPLRPGRAADAAAVAAVHEATARVAYAHIFPPQQAFPTAATRRRWRTFGGDLVVAEDADRLV